ncbi:MAG: FIST N-terminal domain-containing protein [Thermodesulfobacteriota bacterium]
MRTAQFVWTEAGGWSPGLPPAPDPSFQLVLAFGSASAFARPELLAGLSRTFPSACLAGCTTAGEIHGATVRDDSLAATAVAFAHTRAEAAWVRVADHAGSREAGAALAARLDPAGLRHVFVLSDGLAVNGSELVRGMAGSLPPGVGLTGGLAGDADRFRETLVLADGRPQAGAVTAVGLYGERLRVGYGSLGGWDPFGPERVVTSSEGNVLHEMDGHCALDLYKQYLGKHAEGLPATGLLFPLSIRQEGSRRRVVRTVLAVDEAGRSMTFAGDIPQGSYARLMKANANGLVEGALGAARSALAMGPASPALAVLVSCVGRRMVLRQLAEEELEAVRGACGPDAALTGFYSYGEISPFSDGVCELHNQTMTVTTFGEE